MDETTRNAAQSSSGIYTTIAVYAASNALSLAVFLMIYNVATVLQDFRDPMLYAFLCSIALRAPKDWLVERIDWHLSQDRSLVVTLFKAILPPYAAVQFAWAEYKDIVRAFRAKVKEIRAEYQRNITKESTTPGAPTPSAPSSPPRPFTAPAPNVQPFALTVYAKAGLRTFTSRKDRKRRRKRATSTVRTNNSTAPTAGSNRLLFGVALLTLAWAGFEHIRDSWSRASHVVLLSAIVLTILLIIGRSILIRTISSTPPTSTPSKTPITPKSSTAKQQPPSPPRGDFKQPSFLDSPRLLNFAAGNSWAFKTWEYLLRGLNEFGRGVAIVESPIRALLRKNIHALVTLVLIAGLLVGTTGAAAFLTFRIVGEARGVVVSAKDAFPAAWQGVTAVTPMIFDELADINPKSQSGSLEGNNLQADGDLPQIENLNSNKMRNLKSRVPLPPWIESYRQGALSLAQRSLPGMASWLEGRIHGLMLAHNLTDTLWDARLLYEAAQGPRVCSERERSKLLVALAKREVVTRKAREEEEKAGSYAAEMQRNLVEAVAAMSTAMDAQNSCVNDDDQGGGESGGSCSGISNTKEERTVALSELQEHVVTADALLVDAKEAHKAAAAALDDAERARRVADSRSQLCISTTEAALQSSMGSGQTINATTAANAAAQSGLMAGLGARLGNAYSKIFWQFRIREGFSELYSAVYYVIESITKRSGATAAADLSRLQRLIQVAAVPLFGLGRAAAASVGTTTAAAVMGSLGLFRLGLGVVHAAVQAALFLTLLYYLLAAQTDPLARAVALLPLPPSARLRAAAALNEALGGVFMSMLKLAAFHGLFAWVTFRMLGAPLAYTSSVASAAFALLPFVPTYAVAIPGCLVVGLQGRVAAAVALLLLNFGAYYIGDTVVLEDSGGHPFMMSLAILGGLWAFSNPLLGCLLGPTLLSLLSALGTLHTELMGSGNTAALGNAMFLSPAGHITLAKRPSQSQLMATPQDGQILPRPPSLAPLQTPHPVSPNHASPRNEKQDTEEVSLAGLPLSPDDGGRAVGEEDEVQSKPSEATSTASGRSSGSKGGFTFRRRKEHSVKF